MKHLKSISLALALLLAFTAVAQQPQPQQRPGHGVAALGAACDGVWQDIQTANQSLKLMPQQPLTRADRTRLSCLLEAIGRTTFDARDPEFNSFLAMEATWLAVSAYGPAAYDFFAGQLASQQSQPVERGLQRVLLERGHPEAFRRYFAEQRGKGAPGQPTAQPNHSAYVLFEPLIARGTCSSGLCSERLSETVQLVRANLDVVDRQLQAAESFEPMSPTDEAKRDARHVREAARSLRATIGRISRGEAAIGAVTPR